MSNPFLICDPGLLVPPASSADLNDHHYFWARLVEWSTDKRVKLGASSYQAVADVLNQTGWPTYTPPECPSAIAKEARKAVGLLLATLRDTQSPDEAGSTFSPAYLRGAELEAALSADAGFHAKGPLLGAATDPGHWADSVQVVQLEPGPPSSLELIMEPRGHCVREADMLVASRLAGMRITVVGGLSHTPTKDKLKDAFNVQSGQIRWIEAEPDSEPEVDRLDGISPDKDIVVCLTGAIGHSGSLKTAQMVSARGVRYVRVEKRSQIIGEIRRTLGER